MGRPWKAWFDIEQSEADRTVVLYTQVFREGRTVSSRTQMCILKENYENFLCLAWCSLMTNNYK